MKKVSFCFLITCISLFNHKADGQTSFDKAIVFPDSMSVGSSGPAYLLTTRDKNLVFICSRSLFPNYTELFISKFDTSGNPVWSSRIISPNLFYCHGAAEMGDSSFTIGVNVQGVSNGKCSIMHISKDGGLINVSKLICSAPYLGGIIYLTGASDTTVAVFATHSNNYSGIIITDPYGNAPFNRFALINGMETGGNHQACKLKDGGFLYSETIRPPGNVTEQRIGVCKTDSIGNIVWAKQLGDTSYKSYIHDVQELPGGQVILCGNTKLSTGIDKGIVICLGANGTVLWSKVFSPDIHMHITSIISNDSLSFYLTGFYISSGYFKDFFWKMNVNGSIENFKFFEYPNDPHTNGVSERGPDNMLYTLFQRQSVISGWPGLALTKYDDSLLVCNQLPVIPLDSNIVLSDTIQWNDTTFNSITTQDFTSLFTQYYDSVTFLTNCIPNGIDNQTFNTGELFQIYPNPFSEELTVSNMQFAVSNLQFAKEKTEIKLLDIYGRTILSQPCAIANCQLLTADFSPGIYFIELLYNGERIIKKVIKE